MLEMFTHNLISSNHYKTRFGVMYIVHKCKRAETKAMLLGKIKGQSTCMELERGTRFGSYSQTTQLDCTLIQ